MPFPFALPTTSAFSFSSHVKCDSHPSLPISASTYRGVVRDSLKKHKRLPPSSQTSNIPVVLSSLDGYVPYLFALEGAVNRSAFAREHGLRADLMVPLAISWRPTLSGDVAPGRQRHRVKLNSFESEITFVLSSLAMAHSLQARATLQPLYSTSGDFIDSQDRTAAVSAATKSLLTAASIWQYLGNRGSEADTFLCTELSNATVRALASLSLAEATLLAVLKDDPYPAAVAKERNKTDTDWMFKAPDIPKVRAHLYARLCLAASEHAARASSLCQATGGDAKLSSALLRYLDDLRQTSRAKACRFFGIDAELGGKTAEGIGWLRAGFQELGVEVKDSKKGLSFSRLRKDIGERREDRRVDKEAGWGADAGKLEETRVLEMLDAKWNKINDTMNTQVVPAPNTLLSKMPTGREIHTVADYKPSMLDLATLEEMRAPPTASDRVDDDASSDDEPRGIAAAPGAFPDASPGSGPATGGSDVYY